MKPWPAGEIRRIERAYSPKFGCYGYFMLRSFIIDLPLMLQKIVDEHHGEVLLVECTGKQKSPKTGYGYYTFKLIGEYSYSNLPTEYRDSRGQYPPPFETSQWNHSDGNVLGFPLRPCTAYKHPCTVEEYYNAHDRFRRGRRS